MEPTDVALYRGPYLGEIIEMFEMNKLSGGTDDFKQFRQDLYKGDWKKFKINPKDFMERKSGIGSLFRKVKNVQVQ